MRQPRISDNASASAPARSSSWAPCYFSPRTNTSSNKIVNGLRRRLAGVDIVTIRQAGLAGTSDPGVLAWAAEQGRVVVPHDTRTMARHAYDRVAAGEAMPGVVEVPDLMPIGQAIEEIRLLIQLAQPDEIKDRVLRLPL